MSTTSRLRGNLQVGGRAGDRGVSNAPRQVRMDAWLRMSASKPLAVYFPATPSRCAIPCSTAQVFSTAGDNQSQIKVFLYRGKAARVAEAHALGQFEIAGIPKGPRGESNIRVALSVESGNITLSAIDARSEKRLVIRRVDLKPQARTRNTKPPERSGAK